MKKAYIAPSTGVYNVGTAHIIASSGGESSMRIFSTGDVSIDTSTDGGVNQLGREENAGSNVWDSEW